MSSKRKFNRKSKYTLSQKIISAVTAAGFIMQPVVGFAQAIIKADEALHNSTVINKGNVTDIWADKVVGNAAVNVFDKFQLDAGKIANMYFNTIDKQQADAANLVNFVNNRIDINGTVNAVRNNKIGGNLFFLSKEGMAVGKSGVINTGSLYVMTPASDDLNTEWNKLQSQVESNGTFGNDNMIEGWEAIPVNNSGTITVLGKINATNDVQLRAAKIGVGKNVSGELKDDEGTVIMEADAANKEAVIKTGVANFDDIVNIKDTNGNIITNAGLGENLIAEVSGNGDIVLAAVSSVTDERKGKANAVVDVYGNLTGNNVKLSAESEVTFKEDSNALATGGNVGEIQTALMEKVGLGTISANYADVESSAAVTVGQGASINAGGDVSVTAQSKASADVGSAPKQNNDGTFGGFMPAVGVVVADVNNDASVNINGNITADGGIDINAAAETSLTAAAADSGEEAAGSDGKKDPASLIHAAVVVAEHNTNATVNVNNAEIKGKGDVNVTANVDDSLDISAQVGAPGKSAMATAVAVVEGNGAATVNLSGGSIEGNNVTVAAENHLEGNVIKVDNGIGLPQDPADDSSGGSEETTPQEELKDAAMQILGGEKVTDVIANGITDKVVEAIGGTTDNKKQNPFLQKIGNMLDVGASVAVVEESNKANVKINNTNVQAADEGKVDIYANTIVDNTTMIVTGHANKQTHSKKNRGQGSNKNPANIIADAAVLYNEIDNDAAVEINGAAISGKTVNINTSAQMQSNLRKMYNDLKDSVSDLKTALGDTWDGAKDFYDKLDALVTDTGNAFKEAEADNYDDAMIEQLFNEAFTKIQAAAETLSGGIDEVKDSATATVENVQAAKDAFDSVKSNLEAFKDTDNYVNYYVHTESTDGIEGKGSKPAQFELGVAGSVNITNVNNNAAIGIGAGTAINAGESAEIKSDTLTETLSITGNAVALMGSKKKNNNQQGGTPSGGTPSGGNTNNTSSTNIGVGASVAVQDISGNSVVVIGEGVNIGGKDNASANEVTIAADNTMSQQGIVYGSGESAGNNQSATNVQLQGMVNLLNGGSNSVVSIDDNVNIAGNTVNLKADNSSLITAVTGGATFSKSGGNAASVGASLGMVNYDVNNVVVVGDNGDDADLTLSSKDDDEKTAEDKAADKRKEGTKLAKDLLAGAGVTLAEDVNTPAAKGTITAHELNAQADTDGLILNLAVEAAANTKSKKKKPNSALNNLNQTNNNNNNDNNLANQIVGNNGSINQQLNQGDTNAQNAANNGGNISGGLISGNNGGNTNRQLNQNNNQSTSDSVKVAGAGSVSINMLDGETAAIIDGVTVNSVKDAEGKAGTVAVNAEDSLFDGSFAGAAAINWFTKTGSATGGSSSGSSTEVSVGGAAGVSVLDRGVSAVISNSDINNAASITNTATKSGAEIATGLGLAVAASSGSSGGTNVAVGAAVSYNEADSDIYALMVNNAVDSTEEGITTDLTNKAYNKDLQISGGVSVALTDGGKTGVGVGGTAVISQIDNDLQSGIFGGTYNDMGKVDIDAVVATTQVSAAVAGAASVGSSTPVGFGGAVNYSNIDNTNNAFINGATINAGGEVSVVAGDTNGDADSDTNEFKSDYAAWVEEHGIDASGKTGTEWADSGYTDDENNVNFSAQDNTGSTIVNVATAAGVALSEGSSGGSGAAGVNVSQINNDMNANITGAKITAGSVHGQADTNTKIIAVAAGLGVSNGKFGGAGSVSWDELSNNNKVTIAGSTINTGSLTANAMNKADIINVAGQLSGSSGVGVGVAMAYNAMDNTTGVYVNGGTVNLTDDGTGILALNAKNEADIMAITAGATAAQNAAINGIVAVNRGSNSTEAVIGNTDDKVTIIGVKDIDVTVNDSNENLTIAGGITAAGKVAVGAGVAYSDIGGSSGDGDKAQQKTCAEINNADITAAADAASIDVTVNDISKLTTIAAGLGGAGTAAVQGEAATALVNKQVNAGMSGTSINANNADNKSANVNVKANSDTDITTSAAVAAGGGTAGVGAGVAVNRIIQQTGASVNGGTMNINNLDISANSTPRIENIGVGAGAGGTAGVAGSVAVNNIQNNVTAHIGSGADITANNNVGVIATSDEQIANYAGVLAAGGTAGVGVSVSVNQIEGNTSATVGDDKGETYVTALGKGTGLTTDTNIDKDTINNALIDDSTVDINNHIERKEEGETRSGLIVDASSTRDMKSFLVTAGVAANAGVAGTVNVNMIDGATKAQVVNTAVNGGAAASNANVFVNAGDYTNMSGFVGSGGGAGTGAGVGLGSDTNTVSREVSAVVDNSDINAGEFEVDAESMQGVSSFVVGAGVGGIGAGVAGVVTVTELENETKAALHNSNVNANKVTVNANHKGIVNAGNVGIGGAGIGAGVGLSVGVLKDDSKTYAEVSSDDETKDTITASGDVTIAATNTAVVKPSVSATGVAGVGGGVAGATSVNNLNSKVVTNISGVDITSGGSISGTADNTFNVDADMGSQAGGVGGVGVGVTVNTIDSTVQTNVKDSTLDAANDITLTANETRDIEQLATNAQVGGVAAGANIAITNVGQAIENVIDENGETISDAKDKIDDANDVFINEETNKDNSGDLLAGAGDALETAGIDSGKATPHVDAGYGGGKDSQITVNITNSNIEADSTVTAKATETDKINMTLGSGSAGAAAVNAGVGILNVHRNVGVNITGGGISANIIDIDTNITGSANLDVYQGTAGVVGVNAAVGQASTTGSSKIDIDNVTFTGNDIDITAGDHGAVTVNTVGITVGAVSVGAIVAGAENSGNTEIEITSSKAENKNADKESDITISTDKANTVDAHAIGGAGGAVAGQGVVATASDSGASSITLGAVNDISKANSFVVNKVNIAASAKPVVKAVADSAAVSIFGTAGASVATAEATGNVNVNVYDGNTFSAEDVDITADAGTQDGKNTAEAKVVGNSGSGYATVAANAATADVTTKVNVNVGDVNYKTKTEQVFVGYEDVEGSTTGERVEVTKPVDKGATNLNISGSNSSKAAADAKGITIGGIFSSGNNLAFTTNKATTNVSVSGGSEETMLKSLNITATGATDNTAKADGSGGGFASADLAAYAKNNSQSIVDAALSGNFTVEGDVTVNALQNDTANINADALKATVVGASATLAENTIGGEKFDDERIGGTTNVNINGATITGGGKLDVNAANTVTFGNTEKYAVEGSGYGGVNVQGTRFVNTINKAAAVNVMGSTLTTNGTQAFEAKTTGNINAGGYVKAAGLGAFTWADINNTVTSDNSVTVDKDSSLKTKKEGADITLASVDNMDLTVSGVADVQGAAVGGASSDVTNVLNRKNKITVSGDLYAMNDVNLYAGKDKNGAEGKLDLAAESETYNYAALPIADPKLSDKVNQHNQVIVNKGSDVSSVRNINLYADAGKETIRDTTLMYTWVYSDKGENYTSSTVGDKEPENKHSENFVQADGNLIAGVQNKQYITIGGTYNPETGETEGSQLVFLNKDTLDAVKAYGNGQENAVGEDGIILDASDNIAAGTVDYGTFDYGTTLFERYNELGELMQGYAEDTSSTAYVGYKAEQDRIFEQMLAMNLLEERINDDGKKYYTPIDGADIDYVEISDIVASGGNINIQTDTLSGSGSLKAQGAPEVVINNNTNLYMKINNITVGDPGGEINFNNNSLTSENYREKIAGLNADKDKKVEFTLDADAGDGTVGRLVINGNYNSGEIFAKVTLPDDQDSDEVKEQIIKTTPRADIEINGIVNSKNGEVEITSKANNIIIQGETAEDSAAVKGQTVKLSAAGSVSQGFQEGIVNIGGSVQDQYDDLYQDAKDHFDNKYEFTHDSVEDTWRPDSGTNEPELTGNMIAGENIYISASDINVNGKIQSGYADYVVNIDNIDNKMQEQIDTIKDNWQNSGSQPLTDAMVTTGTAYRIVEGKDVWSESDQCYYRQLDVYYNPFTGQIVVPDVDANGGQVYLTGRISSTGSGSIKVLDGAYDINVTNNTGTDLQLGKLVSNNVDGLISIADTGTKQLTEFRRGSTVVKDMTTLDEATGDYRVISEGGEGSVYNPESGLRYNWTTGQETTTTEKYTNTIKAGLWGAVQTMDETQLTEFEQEHKPIPEETKENKPNGEYIGKVNDIYTNENKDNFVVIYENEKLNQDRVGPGEPERWSTGFLGWFKWEKYTWTVKTGTTQQYVASVKADKPISIGFIGNVDGNSKINVKSEGNINLTNDIASASGGTNSVINIGSTGGAINQLGGSITGYNINLNAVTGINDVNITSIGDTVNLNAKTTSGDIGINVNAAYGKKGNVVIGNLFAGTAANPAGDVALTASGNITQSGVDTSVIGNRIDLVSTNGAIGTDTQAIVVHGGQQVVDATDSLSASVNAQAKQNINLTHDNGNMRIGRVYSEDGNVAITVNNGDLIDALPSGETVDRGDTDELIQKWTDLGLVEGTGDYSKKVKQDIADYEKGVEDEFENYLAQKDYYESQSGSVTQEYKDAYNAYSEAKTQYDSLKSDYDTWTKGKIYYTNDAYVPNRDNYRTDAEYQTALAEYNAGKATFEELNVKFNGSASLGDYVADNTGDTYAAYLNPSVTITDSEGKSKIVDLKAEFDGYANYESLKATYGDYTSYEDYLVNNTDAQAKIAELQNAGKEYWDKDQLLYALSEAITNPESGATDTVVKDPNIKGNNITVTVNGGSAGLNSEKTTVINIADLTKPENVDALKQLAGTDASNVIWNETAGTATITEKLPVGIQSTGGGITVITDGNVYLAGRTETDTDNVLNINEITAEGNIRLQGHDGIYNVSAGDRAAITGKDLLIQAGEGGSIGTADKMMTTDISGTMQAQAGENIYISQIGDNDLVLASIGAGEDIVLQAVNNIKNVDSSSAGLADSYIRSDNGTITLTSDTGAIGESGNAIRILDNGVVINANANGDIVLAGVTGTGSGPDGSIVLGTIKGASLEVDSVSSVSIGKDAAEDEEAVEGNITVDGDVSLSAKAGSVTEADNSVITANNVNASATGNILLGSEANKVNSFVVNGLGADNSIDGDIDLVSSSDKGLTVNFNGGITANGYVNVDNKADTKLDITGGSVTTEGEKADGVSFSSGGGINAEVEVNSTTDVDFNVNTGDITLGGDLTANNGNITIDIAGNGDLIDTDLKDTDWNNPANVGNTLKANGPEGSEEAGNIIINVGRDKNGTGDVDLYDLYASNEARVDVNNGDLTLHEINGKLVAIQLRTQGKEMNVGEIIAGTQIVLSGSNMDLDQITQREDADGMLVITPDGAEEDKPIDNFTIGDIRTNDDTGIRFERLWVNNSDIHMSQGQLWFDKLYVEDTAHFSNDNMTAAVYGVPPLRDGSDSVYWNNTAENRPEDNLDLWQSGNGDWMYLRFTDDNIQESNGILLTLDEYDYVYDQRFTAEDHLRWQHGRYLDEDWKQAYGYGLSLHDRYGLIDYQHFTEENAGEDEIAVEA